MPVSPWADYLKRIAAYLNGSRDALESGGWPPEETVTPRPDCPLTQEQAWLIMDLVVEASGMLDAGVLPERSSIGQETRSTFRPRELGNGTSGVRGRSR
jgi:hypothetical protein